MSKKRSLFTKKKFPRVRRARRNLFEETLLGWPLLIGAIGAVILVTFQSLSSDGVSLNGFMTEFSGFLLDVFVIVMIFGLVQHRALKKKEIQDQLDIIDDLKGIGTVEANHRVLGALRRLNRSKATSINLNGSIMKDVSLRQHGVQSLKGSVLSGGKWSDFLSSASVYERVRFDHIDMSDVVFSHWNWTYDQPDGKYLDCDFEGADLRGADFSGASLEWSESPPEQNWEYFEDGEHSHAQQIHFGPFHEAYLEGVIFKNALLRNVDFRGAFGVRSANFSGAKGLETCIFNSDEELAAAIESSKVVERRGFFAR